MTVNHAVRVAQKGFADQRSYWLRPFVAVKMKGSVGAKYSSTGDEYSLLWNSVRIGLFISLLKEF